MGLLDAFRDPNEKPKAIALSIAIGAALIGAGYYFWSNRQEVADDLKTAGRKIEKAAEKVGDMVERAAERVGDKVQNAAHNVSQKVNKTFTRASEKFASAKDRVAKFKDLHFDRFVNAKKLCIRDGEDRPLSQEAISTIHELAMEMSEKDFKNILKVNREQRRTRIEHDKPHYEEIAIDGIKEFENLFTENLNSILAECGVSRDQYDQSIKQLTGVAPTYHIGGYGLYEAMLNRVPSVSLPDSGLEQLFVDVQKFMDEQYHKIMYRPLSKEHFVDVKRKMLLDKVHEKFGIEEEDIFKLKRLGSGGDANLYSVSLVQQFTEDEKNFGPAARQ